MSRIQLLILWALALVAGFFYFKSKVVPDDINSQTKLEIGSDLIAGNTVESIDQLKITLGEDTVTLKKTDDQWLVAEKGDFPAEITTVSRVLDALRSTKVAQGVVASNEYYDRFELDPEAEEADEKPGTIAMKAGDQEALTLYLGKNRESTGGQNQSAGRFVRLSDDDSGVYIVSETFSFLGADPGNWIQKIVTPLEEGALRMEMTAPNDATFKPWTLSRKTVMDDFLVEGLGEKEETKTNVTGTLKTSFSRASFSKLVDPEEFETKADKKGMRQLKATDSGGSTFLITITPQKEEKKDDEKKDDPNAPMPSIDYFVQIEVLNGPTKPEPLGEDASVQEKAVYQQRLQNLDELTESVNRMRETYKDRIFLVNKAAIGKLTNNRGEFIKPKKKKKEPVTVTTPPIRVPSADDDISAPDLSKLPDSPKPPPSLRRPEETKPVKPQE